MSWNANDRKEFEKKAKEEGYRWNSDHTKMINDQGKSAWFSSTGKSGYVNGTHYGSSSDAKKGKQW